jgi:NADPH-dependent curcumin reductase CurA
MSEVNRQIIFKERPAEKLEASHFEARDGEIPEPGDGEVLMRTLYLSLDAANRAWMQGKTYKEPVLPGEVMHGYTISEVVSSNSDRFVQGDLVEGQGNWQEYSVVSGRQLAKVTPRGPLSHQLSILGITGLTAYFGLLRVGEPQEGETLVVSAAAGAVGNVVGQIGNIKGCRVVGIAGSDEKCKWLTDELGFDAAINYKSEDVFGALKKACPDGIDVYFDNVGGDILSHVLFQMNLHGRVACCGAVSQYDVGAPDPSPPGIPGLLVVNRIKMEGFIVMDYFSQRESACDEISQWVIDGRVKIKEDIIEGLENAPAALVGLLRGENYGKRMIHVADPSD